MVAFIETIGLDETSDFPDAVRQFAASVHLHSSIGMTFQETFIEESTKSGIGPLQAWIFGQRSSTGMVLLTNFTRMNAVGWGRLLSQLTPPSSHISYWRRKCRPRRLNLYEGRSRKQPCSLLLVTQKKIIWRTTMRWRVWLFGRLGNSLTKMN